MTPMELATAVSLLNNAVKLLSAWSELKEKARSENRSISPEEMDAIKAKYELSDDLLDDAIGKAEEREAGQESGSKNIDDGIDRGV